MRLGQYIEAATHILIKAGVDSPRLSAEVLAHETLCAAMPLEERTSARLFCLIEAQRRLAPDTISKLDTWIRRRAAGQPLAHITGHKEFYGREFLVTPHTLIPRPETELLIETTLQLLLPQQARFADLGTGSGCIGLTLAAERLQWRGLLLDISDAALTIAAGNARRLRLGDRTGLLRGDLMRPPLRRESLDLLVSNPPYIAEAERPLVMTEVLNNEPIDALFSEKNGLNHLGAVIAAGALALRNGGFVVLEHGAQQGPAVQNLLKQTGVFKKIETKQDLAQLNRCTMAQKDI